MNIKQIHSLIDDLALNDSLALYYYSFLKSLCIVWIYIILPRRDSTSFKLKYELLRLELLLLQWMWYFLGRCEIFLFGVSSPPTDQKLVTGPSLILAWAGPFFGGFRLNILRRTYLGLGSLRLTHGLAWLFEVRARHGLVILRLDPLLRKKLQLKKLTEIAQNLIQMCSRFIKKLD